MAIIKKPTQDFPGGPVAKTLCSQCRGLGVQALVRELDPTCCNQRVHTPQLKILHATTKTQHSQINKYIAIIL